jgi:hypothetical protein
MQPTILNETVSGVRNFRSLLVEASWFCHVRIMALALLNALLASTQIGATPKSTNENGWFFRIAPSACGQILEPIINRMIER